MLVILNLNQVYVIVPCAAVGSFPVVFFGDVRYVPCISSRALYTRFSAGNSLWILIAYRAG